MSFPGHELPLGEEDLEVEEEDEDEGNEEGAKGGVHDVACFGLVRLDRLVNAWPFSGHPLLYIVLSSKNICPKMRKMRIIWWRMRGFEERAYDVAS